ncbi:MAG: DUF2059 domain-containing protein [Pseudomonadota bacterium]|nr:DUF2059 domain-containing protein [Pseudomonadota bacterium]
MDALIAFYESPAGQSYLANGPALVQGAMALSVRRMQALLPKMNALLN